MNANEAPEKIYIGIVPSISGGQKYTTVNKDFPNAVEYTRTDAFIEKAWVWLELNLSDKSKEDIEFWLKDFRQYMEGE